MVYVFGCLDILRALSCFTLILLELFEVARLTTSFGHAMIIVRSAA